MKMKTQVAKNITNIAQCTWYSETIFVFSYNSSALPSYSSQCFLTHWMHGVTPLVPYSLLCIYLSRSLTQDWETRLENLNQLTSAFQFIQYYNISILPQALRDNYYYTHFPGEKNKNLQSQSSISKGTQLIGVLQLHSIF